MRILKIGLERKAKMTMMAEKINRRMTTNIIIKRMITMKTIMMMTICMMNVALGGTTYQAQLCITCIENMAMINAQ